MQRHVIKKNSDSIRPYGFMGKRLLNRKKQDPSKFIFTGDSSNGAPDLHLFVYNKSGCEEKKNLNPAEAVEFRETDKMYWLNIYGLNNPDLIAEICHKIGVHSLAIQDILDVNQRPKYQEFENFAFLTIKSIVPESTDMAIEQISFVFARNYLVSFQEKKSDYFDHLRYRLRENKGILREMGPDYLLFTMLEAILDNYFRVLQHLDEEAEATTVMNIKSDPSPLILQQIEKIKKMVHLIRKSIVPIREFVLVVERSESVFIGPHTKKYYLEIKDLCLTLIDSCDTITSTLESNTNLFFSVQGHRMNQVMKTLTVVATIFIPLTFVAGIYGMNFTYMPELEWKYGYAFAWAVFLLIFIGMIIYFKRKKWF